MNKNTKLAILVILGASIILIPIQFVFIAMLFGLLLAPPLLVFASVLREGAPVIAEEMDELLKSEEKFIISISERSIILEPNISR